MAFIEDLLEVVTDLGIKLTAAGGRANSPVVIDSAGLPRWWKPWLARYTPANA
jgi:hypothetical protein